MAGGGHIDPGELGRPVLTADAEAHVAACVQCRAERRVRLAEGPSAPARAPEEAAYVLGRRLGAGAMGVVFEARGAGTGARHAVKRLRGVDLGPAHVQLRARMLREGRLQARVVHPNVVPVTDVVEIDGAPALVMPFVDGPTLAEVIAGGALPLGLALGTFRAIAAGAAAIHAAGLVHRDLKPGNVLLEGVGDDVVPRVTDFGLAKAPAELATLQTRTGAVLGTPAYAAPEQLVDAGAAGPAADVYSLGCVLFELVTGRLAYRGAGPADVPAFLRDLVSAALAPDPSARPPDAAALLCAFDDAARAAGVVVPTHLGSLAARTRAGALTAPAPADPGVLVGREGVVATLAERLLRGAPWTTVVGEPGVGKTRVALRAVRADPRRPARWCSLDGAVGPDEVLERVAVTLTLRVDAADVVAVGRALAHLGPGVLVLDGLDGVGDEDVRALSAAVGAEAPALRIVATRRGAPGVSGDAPIHVAPLDAAAATALLGAPSPGGNPLALSLGGAGDVVEVAARLRAGSPDSEQTAWDQLGVFVGPFSLSAAEQILGDPWAVERIQPLVERGVVRVVDGPGPGLVLPAALRSAGDDAARSRHARWFGRHGDLAALPELWAWRPDTAERVAAEGAEVLAAAARYPSLGDPTAAGAVVAAVHLLAACTSASLAAGLLRRCGPLPAWAEAACAVAVDVVELTDAERLATCAAEIGDVRLSARVELAWARGLANVGRTDEARARVDGWLGRADLPTAERAVALATLAVVLGSGREESLDALRESVVLAERSHHPLDAARARAKMGR